MAPGSPATSGTDDLPPACIDLRSLPIDLRVDRFFDLSNLTFRHVFSEAETVLDMKRCVERFFEEHARREVRGQVHPGAHVEGDVVVEPGARVETGALVEGPAWICAGAIIRHAAYVRDGSIIGPQTKIGHASEVARSVVMAHSFATHFAFIGDSVIGNNVNVGSSCVFANLKVSRAVTEPATHEVTIDVGGVRIATGYTKFGAIVGDGSRTASHVSISPGTLLGKGVVLHTRAQVGGVLPSGSVVRA